MPAEFKNYSLLALNGGKRKMVDTITVLSRQLKLLNFCILKAVSEGFSCKPLGRGEWNLEGMKMGLAGGASQRQGEDLLETWIITVFVAKQPFHH